ncbi:acyltransferase family protein [Piscinibacter sp.]|jgi:fucose 4-O-acetylase-like acetyltransferase|uniref:acyltransferase family protein n=1 Tax=Piscinibacter sp. TaxID=1903157 RepID=UPI002F3FCA2B
MQPSTQASLRLSEARAGAAVGRPARERSDWVDAAKGVGILLVVLGHALDGLIQAGLVPSHGPWARSFFLIYTFHMPLFFFLAGLFVKTRLERDRGEFVRSAAARIAWPYVLWSIVQLLVIAAMGAAVNRPTTLDLQRIVSLLWDPTSQFWFLQALLILHLLSRWVVPRFGAACLLAAAVVARALVEVIALPVALALPCRFGVFYALGVVFGPLLMRHAQSLRRLPMLAVGLAGAALWALAASAADDSGRGYWSVAAVPAALAGSVAALALAPLARGAPQQWLRALGRSSMAIYVLHVLFVAGMRIALHKWLGLDDPRLILALAVSSGVAGPLLVRWLAVRLNASRALGLG